MIDVLFAIALLVAVLWWFGRDTTASRAPESRASRRTPPAASGSRPVDGRAEGGPASDDAFVDGLIIGAYYYGPWGHETDEGPADLLPGLGENGFPGGEEFEDKDDWSYGRSSSGDPDDRGTVDDGFDDLGAGSDDVFGLDDDFDF